MITITTSSVSAISKITKNSCFAILWICQKQNFYRPNSNILRPRYNIRKLPSSQHISKINVWKNYFTTISLWSPTNSGAKISVLLKGFRICKNISTTFLGFGSYRPVCLKKAQNLEVFYSSPFWNLNFEISKVNFL